MKIFKFGGTSVNTKERIEVIRSIVKSNLSEHPIIVVSALRGVTDLLLSCIDAKPKQQRAALREVDELHKKLIRELWSGNSVTHSDRYLARCLQEIEAILEKTGSGKSFSDRVISYGEKLAAFIISEALTTAGIKSQQVTADTLIVTDGQFGAAEFLPDLTREKTRRVLLPLLKRKTVPVITGFIGATEAGEITTLGRGGSDYSAAIIGYCLDATEIQIWTDVDGIYSADPRLVPTAARIPEVSFREASELATFGAKVLHPRTIRPAVSAGIPVRVLSTLTPESEGTVITSRSEASPRIVAVASKPEITLVNLYATEMLLSRGFLKRIFAVFESCNISVDVVSVSEVSVSVTLDNDEHLGEAIQRLKTFTTVTVKKMSMVSLVGEGIARVPHVMRNIFTLLDTAGIPVTMISLGASEINVSLVVEIPQAAEAVWLLHERVIRQQSEAERSYL